MDFLNCVRGRRSVRRFMETPVAHEVLEHIVRTASYAPSWKNLQIVRYMVIESPAQKSQLAERCVMGYKPNAAIIQSAPAVVLVNMVTGRAGYERDGSFSTGKGDRWEMFDAGVATQTFCLAAYEAGLGTVIMGIFDEAETAKTAGIPEGQKVAAIVAIGYPDETPPMPRRKTVEELILYQ